MHAGRPFQILSVTLILSFVLVLTGPAQAAHSAAPAQADALVQGGALHWNSFLGGTSLDAGASIAVDGSGNAYTVGQSPRTWGNPRRPLSGQSDAFVAGLLGGGPLYVK